MQIVLVAAIAVGLVDRHGMDLGRGNRHLVDQGGPNHGEVQSRIASGHAALVDHPQVGLGPVAGDVTRIRCQQLVEPLRAGASRQGQVHRTGLIEAFVQREDEIMGQPLRHRLGRGFDDEPAAQSAKIVLGAHGGKSKSGEAAGSVRDTVLSGLRHGPCGFTSSSASAGPQLPAG